MTLARIVRIFSCCLISLLLMEQARSQNITAVEVVSYSEGTGTSASLRNSSAALGLPNEIVPGFPDEVLNPFTPHYTSDNIVQVGTGGELTLRLSHYITLDDTVGVFELGVLENIFLIQSGGVGQNSNPASIFGADSAVLEVSQDGINFFSLGLQNFNQPGNYWNDSPSKGVAGTVAADFGKPFEADLSDFDGLNYMDTLIEFNGSGGGTWFDVPTSIGVTEVGWVRFSGVTTGELEVDSVFGNTALKGVATIPEPSSLLLLLLGMGWIMACRRR